MAPLDPTDRSFDRAFDALAQLIEAKIETVHAELRAINQRLNRVARVEERVEGLDSRMTAMEAFRNAQEERLRESRAYRRIHKPTLILTCLAITIGVVGVLAGFLH